MFIIEEWGENTFAEFYWLGSEHQFQVLQAAD